MVPRSSWKAGKTMVMVIYGATFPEDGPGMPEMPLPDKGGAKRRTKYTIIPPGDRIGAGNIIVFSK